MPAAASLSIMADQTITAEILISVRVMFFGAAKEAAGAEEITLSLDQSSNVARLREIVNTQFPKIGSFGRSMFVAVNQEYAHDEDLINAGDEIAFFPPVSGG